MSEDDLPNALGGAAGPVGFPTLPDRLQQGFLDFLYIGRALVHPQGLAADPAFRDGGGPLIDTRRLFYYGNSQGGIAGGALTAIAPDFNRSVLYVGGDELQPAGRAQRRLRPVRRGARPAPTRTALERPLLLSLIQMLWDRGEPNGYAWHMTSDPLPGHAAAQGAPARSPSATTRWRTSPRRSRRARSARGCACRRSTRAGTRRAARTSASRALRRFPSGGDATLVVWDIGPLRGGRRPRHAAAADHEHAAAHRRRPARPGDRVGGPVRRQIAEFLRIDGRVIDVCGAFPCHAAGWTGP